MRGFLNLLGFLLLFGGITVIVGTAGASDLGQIEFTDIVIRELVGLILTVIGYIGLRIGGLNYGSTERGN